MRILSVISSLSPAAGGPVESCLTLNRKFRQLGHEADVLSCESGHEPWIKNLPFKLFLAGPHYIGNYAFAPGLVARLRALKDHYDGIVVHGIWQYQGFALLKAFQDGHPPFAVFVHGNLDPYFIHNFPIKNLKKALHYRLIEAQLFKQAQAVLFTCEEELRLAAIGYRPLVGNRQVVRYGIDPPDFDPQKYKGQFSDIKERFKGKHLVLFFGRIHPKKGCDLLLEAFATLADQNINAQLLMVGPDETGWIAQLQVLAQRLGIANRVSWLGPAYGSDKWFLFSIADVFVLPSHMENFGLAIAEAMSLGVPVLISDKINIHTEIIAAGAGFSAPDTIVGTKELLSRWFALSPSDQQLMGEKAKQLVSRRFLAEHAAQDILNILQSSGSRSNGHQTY